MKEKYIDKVDSLEQELKTLRDPKLPITVVDSEIEL